MLNLKTLTTKQIFEALLIYEYELEARAPTRYALIQTLKTKIKSLDTQLEPLDNEVCIDTESEVELTNLIRIRQSTQKQLDQLLNSIDNQPN